MQKQTLKSLNKGLECMTICSWWFLILCNFLLLEELGELLSLLYLTLALLGEYSKLVEELGLDTEAEAETGVCLGDELGEGEGEADLKSTLLPFSLLIFSLSKSPISLSLSLSLFGDEEYFWEWTCLPLFDEPELPDGEMLNPTFFYYFCF